MVLIVSENLLNLNAGIVNFPNELKSRITWQCNTYCNVSPNENLPKHVQGYVIGLWEYNLL